MYPVECSLSVWQSRSWAAKRVRIRCNAESHAIHDSGEAHVGFRQHVNICAHPGRNVAEISFAKIANDPPCSHIDECEDLLADMRVSAFRDGEIGHSRIERRIDSTIVEIVAGCLYSRRARSTLVDEWFERGYGVQGLVALWFLLLPGNP